MPQTRKAFFSSSFDPDCISTLAGILEDVWSLVAPLYGSDERAIAAARMCLAQLIVELAVDRQLSAREIRKMAVRHMRDAALER